MDSLSWDDLRMAERSGAPHPSTLSFHDADFVQAAASNLHTSVGRCRHVADHAATRRNDGALEFVGLRIELNDRVGLYSRFAVPDLAIRRYGDTVRTRIVTTG